MKTQTIQSITEKAQQSYAFAVRNGYKGTLAQYAANMIEQENAINERCGLPPVTKE